jgi:hypothetical protein
MSSETPIDPLVEALMTAAIQQAGAERGMLIMRRAVARPAGARVRARRRRPSHPCGCPRARRHDRDLTAARVISLAGQHPELQNIVERAVIVSDSDTLSTTSSLPSAHELLR